MREHLISLVVQFLQHATIGRISGSRGKSSPLVNSMRESSCRVDFGVLWSELLRALTPAPFPKSFKNIQGVLWRAQATILEASSARALATALITPRTLARLLVTLLFPLVASTQKYTGTSELLTEMQPEILLSGSFSRAFK